VRSDGGVAPLAARERMAEPIRRRRLPPDPATGWEAWELTRGGERVGLLVEHRAWRGTRYGARRWIAVHNPELAPYRALWASEPQKTMRAALALLAERLDRPPG
jgi:hypothetical protein